MGGFLLSLAGVVDFFMELSMPNGVECRLEARIVAAASVVVFVGAVLDAVVATVSAGDLASTPLLPPLPLAEPPRVGEIKGVKGAFDSSTGNECRERLDRVVASGTSSADDTFADTSLVVAVTFLSNFLPLRVVEVTSGTAVGGTDVDFAAAGVVVVVVDFC